MRYKVICLELRMGRRSGQGMNPDDAPCEVSMLTDEVFYNPGQARQTHSFAASGSDRVSYWGCRQQI